ncbi:MAG: hypothetical protein JJ895_05700 [Balneolaceae bacterium]|nr:hypothetical protein [Balneolaceae bacterium]
MLAIDWISVLFLISGSVSAVILFIVAKRTASVSNLFFGLSALSFTIGVLLGLINDDFTEIAREWGDLLGMTLVLCGLFVKTRNSKPIFARFPMPMTMLPLIGVLFYPLINQAEVIKDLLWITYQGGAIVVAILVISINHLMYKQRALLLLACLILGSSFAIFWFVTIIDRPFSEDIANVMLSAGMLISALGFKKIGDLNIKRQKE